MRLRRESAFGDGLDKGLSDLVVLLRLKEPMVESPRFFPVSVGEAQESNLWLTIPSSFVQALLGNVFYGSIGKVGNAPFKTQFEMNESPGGFWKSVQ